MLKDIFRKLSSSPALLISSVSLSIVIILMTLVFCRAIKEGHAGKLTVGIGDNSVEIDIDQGKVEGVEILKQIFSNDSTRKDAVAILKEIYGIYHYQDEDIVAKFAALEFNAPVSRRIRELKKKCQGPFNSKLETVYIQPQNDKSISGRYASVCLNSDFFSEKIVILEPTKQRMISVDGIMTVDCSTEMYKPLIRINIEFVKELFPDDPMNKQLSALAKVKYFIP